MRALIAWIAVCGCGRVGFERADAPDAVVDGSNPITLAISTGQSDGGFAFIVYGPVGGFGTAADYTANLISTLRLFENGVEIGPAHSPHVDIRALGAGRFSHWTETSGLNDTIRFSASDNSDPMTNGRLYTYLTQ